MDLKGKLLGNRYEIIEKVGNGGMAAVYKAKCHVLNRYVAVKVLKDEFTTDEDFIKRFNTEAQAAASLTHPNIVSVYDVGTEENLHYIVMELIKGKTLKDIINEDGALSWKWAINVAIQIASALETAHKNNIIHRDIKPHNIIITEDGMAKVTDFGIAKAVSNSTITAFGSTMGSVHYFSPEHARGGFTDSKSDLYSLGVVLYEMVTGMVPFNADTPVSVALKHMQEDAKEPIEINSSIPKSVNKIIMKAMKKDINLRYQSATEMLIDLSKALKNPNDDLIGEEFMEKDFHTQRFSPIYNKEVKNEKKKKENFIKKHKTLSIIIGLILLFIFTVISTFLILGMTVKKDVQIPNLVGMETSQAQSKARELKLEYAIAGEAYNKDVLAGCIISQDPSYIENYGIKEGSTITVIISKGRNIVIVPKVVGLKVDEATSQLEGLDLVVEIVEEYSKKIEEGYVIEQDIAAKTEIDAGEKVTIKVSKGIEKVLVPNVIGKTEEEAKKVITENGLKVKTEVGVDENFGDGLVISQDIEANTEVEKDTFIKIKINSLPVEKKAIINLNLKSVLKDKIKYIENILEDGTVVKEAEKVRLEIKVNDESVYSDANADPLAESISPEFKGKGKVNIKIFVNGAKEREEEFDLEKIERCVID